jgi:hypothetical protein
MFHSSTLKAIGIGLNVSPFRTDSYWYGIDGSWGFCRREKRVIVAETKLQKGKAEGYTVTALEGIGSGKQFIEALSQIGESRWSEISPKRKCCEKQDRVAVAEFTLLCTSNKYCHHS